MASAVKVKVWARTIIVESKGNVWLSNIGYYLTWASLVGQTVKNLPAQQETWVQSKVRKIPGEGNGNPLHYSCQESSMDREVWWDTVHGVTKDWTQLSD